jgi:hypothetical protein
MAFSAALGAAGSVLGGIFGMGAAKAQAEAAMYDSAQRRETERDMMELIRAQTGIGSDLIRREGDLLRYAQDQNLQNAMLGLDQRDYGRRLVDSDRQQAMVERIAQLQRIQDLDYSEQTEYERRLAALQNNARITTSERQQAIAELRRAQEVARQERAQQIEWFQADISRLETERDQGLSYLNYNRDVAQRERDFDIGQLQRGQRVASSERAQALGYLEDARRTARTESERDASNFERAADQRRSERNFQESEYRNMRAQAMAERMFDVERRNQIDSAIGRFSDATSEALNRMGERTGRNYLGEDEIAAESSRREQVAVDDINRMADRVASVNEAGLIRSGMDASTKATASRSDITARLATEMAKARESARSEAIRYVAGVNDNLKLSEDMENLRREAVLRDVSAAYGTPIEMLMRSPEVRSAMGGPSFSDVGSAVYDRSIQSANDYRGPLDVGSANYNMQVGSAGSYNSPLNVGSTVMDRRFSSSNDYRSPMEIGSAAYNGLTENLGNGMTDAYQFQSGIGPSAYGFDARTNWQLPDLSTASGFFSGAMGGMEKILGGRQARENASNEAARLAAIGAGAGFTNAFKELGSLFGGSGGSRMPSISDVLGGMRGGFTPPYNPLPNGGGSLADYGW